MGNQRDGQQAAALTLYLDFSQVDWITIINRSQSRAREVRFRSLALAIAIQLERVELVLKDELQASPSGCSET
jgi:hypothetical protein